MRQNACFSIEYTENKRIINYSLLNSISNVVVVDVTNLEQNLHEKITLSSLLAVN